MTLGERLGEMEKKFNTLYQRWYRTAVRSAREERTSRSLERKIRLEKLLDQWETKSKVYRGLATMLGSIPEGRTPVYLTHDEKTKLCDWLNKHRGK